MMLRPESNKLLCGVSGCIPAL